MCSSLFYWEEGAEEEKNMESGQKYRKKVITIIFIVCLLVFAGQYAQIKRPVLVNTQGRTFETAVVIEILRDNLQNDGSRAGDQIVLLRLTSGNQSGQALEANCPNGMLFGTVCEPGKKVIVISSQIKSLEIHTVYSLDRSLPILLFVGVFFLLLCLVGGRKGVKSAVALLITFCCFLFLFFPMLLRGVAPIWAAVYTSLLILVITIWLINGSTCKALAAGTSAFGGVLIAGIAAGLFGYAAGLSGYNVSNIEALMFIGQSTSIDVGQLLFAGILFSSLGAVMDIAMDVSAAVDEMHRLKPEMQASALFTSGMNVGRDVMGTMASTLILAFFGGSLGIWVLDYVYALPYLQLINSNAIGIELMQGLSGSFGVIFTVPLAAFCSAWLPKWLGRR